ncbi:hypothetical protein Acy02nite_36670 [Actinoplanes cyaneus]|uniref:Uncharacterized protein n=2 Tax=Actinoplanes cyaneus TaxID=52696 RepID=A0A919IJR2_9ACTN|nr:hypothetical protein Acy02nite_36670 [Actinoplanes cyaneus]
MRPAYPFPGGDVDRGEGDAARIIREDGAMRFDAPRQPGWRDLRAELRRGLAEGRLPVLGVPDRGDARFQGWESSGELLIAVTVEYGDPQESWLGVEAACWTGTIRSTPDLRETLKDHLRIAGIRFADVTWTESEASITLDGRELPARVVRAGDDWWAARAVLDDIEVGLTAYRTEIDLRVVTLPDAMVATMLNAPLVRQQWPVPEPAGEPADPGGEPHRRLVHSVLRSARETLVWLDEGGPSPRQPQAWPEIWRSAIRRQAELSGESEAVAEVAVQSLLSHLTSLQTDAAWFREDERLRERAISETLLYATGLSEDVPSRPAQEAWLERQGIRPQTARPETGDLWRDAWSAWADQVR